MKVAVLLTCHNRRDLTLQCLEYLYNASIPDFDVFLTDDGCTDHTSDAISLRFPKVHILQGSGNLFWSRGMNNSWHEALKFGPYDFYIWLNDDVVLYDYFFTELITCYNSKADCIVTGLIQSNDSDYIIYGGRRKDNSRIQATGKMEDVYYMNGNVVLISRKTANKIGTLDSVFHHSLGDYDYGLTARENGIPVYTTTCAVGFCKGNKIYRQRKRNMSIFKRFHYLFSPLGRTPYIQFHFVKKHFGIIKAVLSVSQLIFVNVLSDRLVDLLYGEKYK